MSGFNPEYAPMLSETLCEDEGSERTLPEESVKDLPQRVPSVSARTSRPTVRRSMCGASWC